jgi:hypothetical protein
VDLQAVVIRNRGLPHLTKVETSIRKARPLPAGGYESPTDFRAPFERRPYDLELLLPGSWVLESLVVQVHEVAQVIIAIALLSLAVSARQDRDLLRIHDVEQ